MICPIITAGGMADHDDGMMQDCLREDCAMWDVERDCCGLRTLSPSDAKELLE